MKRKRPVATVLWLMATVALLGLGWLWWLNRDSATQNRHLPSSSGQAMQHNEPIIAVMRKETNRVEPTDLEKAATIPKRSTNIPAGPLIVSNATRVTATSGEDFPRPVQNTFELQLALARQCLSPGSLDGVMGTQTRAALRCFQQREAIAVTGGLDDKTRQLLLLSNAPTKTYVVTTNDVARLQPLSSTWLGKSQQTALDYENLLEFLAEKSQSSPGLIRRLNPTINWSSATAGTKVELPEVATLTPSGQAAFLTIKLADKVLEAWDENTNLLAHFPCSIAQRVEKRPVGELHVAAIALKPNYTFDPANFPESPEAQQLATKLILPPGPNNPVGIAWIGLDKPGYGIHGTPQPEQVGRTESHGCFRLANWNVDYLVHLVSIGTPVRVEP